MIKHLFLSLALLLSPFAGASETPLPSPQVVIKTSEGDITLRLFRDKAPVTVENFLAYVDSGFYNGTIFHRVIPNFIIQGGDIIRNDGTGDRTTGDHAETRDHPWHTKPCAKCS